MLRLLGIMLLLVAGGLGYLSRVDRQSAQALTVVEWEGRLGLPLDAAAAAIGLLFVGLSLGGRRRRRPVERPEPRRPRAPTGDLPAGDVAMNGEGWLAALSGRAGALALEPGASVTVDPGRVPPVSLRLDRVTPERARRSLEVYAEWLATIPTPPRADVHYHQCPAAGPPRQHQVQAALRRYFPADRVNVVAVEDRVDILFSAPDGRWGA